MDPLGSARHRRRQPLAPKAADGQRASHADLTSAAGRQPPRRCYGLAMKKSSRSSARPVTLAAPSALVAVVGGGLTAVGNGFVGVTADGPASHDGTAFTADSAAQGSTLFV
jgi:hypothetical protein